MDLFIGLSSSCLLLLFIGHCKLNQEDEIGYYCPRDLPRLKTRLIIFHSIIVCEGCLHGVSRFAEIGTFYSCTLSVMHILS